MGAGFEDPFGIGGRSDAGLILIVHVSHIEDPKSQVFVPEQLEYTSRGDPLLVAVTGGGRGPYGEDAVVGGAGVVGEAEQVDRIHFGDFFDDETFVDIRFRRIYSQVSGGCSERVVQVPELLLCTGALGPEERAPAECEFCQVCRNWIHIRLDNFREGPRFHVEPPAIDLDGPVTEVGTRCRIDNKERPGMFEDICRFQEGLARVDESPNPLVMTAAWEPQCGVGLGVIEIVELENPVVVEEDHAVFVSLQNRGKTEGKTAHEKPKQEEGLS